MMAARILIVSLLVFFVGCASKKTVIDDINELPPTASSGEAVLSLHLWTGISGKPVRNLVRNTKFPHSPTSIEPVSIFDYQASKGDKYGERITGLLVVPETGGYQFWVSGDESAELWLSQDQTPFNKRLIAYTNKPTLYQEWTKYGSQKSSVINLEAGEKYFIEVLHKENLDTDHLSVSWKGPNFEQELLTAENVFPMAEADQVSGENAFKEGYHTGYTAGSYLSKYDDTYPTVDTDGDGLPDFYELLVGLDPNDITDAYSDVDGDLLTAYEEYQILSNPNNGDTDGDGIPDGFEFVYGMNALDAADALLDTDDDGINNYDEYLAGTAPDDQADFPSGPVTQVVQLSWAKPTLRSDGTSLSASDIDSYKVYSGTSVDTLAVLSTISDPNVLNYSYELSEGTKYFAVTAITVDGQESGKSGLIAITLGPDGDVSTQSYDSGSSDPALADSDGDGMSDAFEIQYGFDPADPSDAALDADGDGFTNLEEFIAGTVPYVDPGAEPTTRLVTLSWEIPSTRADGTALQVNDISAYKLYSGSNAESLSLLASINDPFQVTYSTEMAFGTHYYAISTITVEGQEGSKSDVVTLVVQ